MIVWLFCGCIVGIVFGIAIDNMLHYWVNKDVKQ